VLSATVKRFAHPAPETKTTAGDASRLAPTPLAPQRVAVHGYTNDQK